MGFGDSSGTGGYPAIWDPNTSSWVTSGPSGPLYYYSSTTGAGHYPSFIDYYPTAAPANRESDVSPSEGVLPLLYGRRKVAGQFVYLNIINYVIHAIYVFVRGRLTALNRY